MRKITRWMKSASGQRVTHITPALAVFSVAAYQSYWHTVEVVLSHTIGHAETAYMMPISVDGLMIVAARYLTHAKTRLARTLAAVGFVLGTGATVASNLMAADPTTVSRVVSVWPAVALTAVACILHWGERKPVPAKRARTATVTKATSHAKLKSVG